MKRIIIIIIISIVLTLFLSQGVNAQENYSGNVTITTPYLKITLDLNKGGRIIGLHSDLEGNYNYGSNLIAQGEHKEISDGLYWTGSVDGWFTQLYGDQTEAAVNTYELLGNSTFLIQIYLSTITSYRLENDINWTWILTIPKNKSMFYINHSMKIINPEFSGSGSFDFVIVPEINNSPVFSNEYDWIDLSGINTDWGGLGVIMEGMNNVEWKQQPWMSQKVVSWWYNSHISLNEGDIFTGFSTFLLHGDYEDDDDASNDWKYIAKLYGFLCGDDVCDPLEACYSCPKDCGYCADSITFSNWNPSNNSISDGRAIGVYVTSLNDIEVNEENIKMWINDEVVSYNAYKSGDSYRVRYDVYDPLFTNGSTYRIKVFVMDNGSFTANTSWQFTYKDMKAPNITIISPEWNEYFIYSPVWLNISTDENAVCNYFVISCLEEGPLCNQSTVKNFSYTNGINHSELLNLNDYQEKMTRMNHTINMICFDEYNNTGTASVMFRAYLKNSPPRWLQEPQDQTLEQGSTLLYDVNASDDDNDTLTYSIGEVELGYILTLIDNDYTNTFFEGGYILAKNHDVLRDGETKTYTINGKDYEVTAVFIDSGATPFAKFSINGVLTKELEEDESERLSETVEIEVHEILSNQREGLVEFSLRIYDNTYIVIKAMNNSDDQLMLQYLKYKILAEEDIYIPAGKGVKEFLSEPEDMLTDKWDIVYPGLMDTGVSTIKFNAVSNHSYELEFENANEDEYDFPLITNKNGIFKYGDDDNDFIFKEPYYMIEISGLDNETFISIGDYFALSDKETTINEDKAVTSIMRYKSINISNHTMLFEDLVGDTYVVPYSGAPGAGAYGELIVEGANHSFWIGNESINESENYALAMDLDASGSINNAEVRLVVRGGGILDMGTQTFTNRGNGTNPGIITEANTLINLSTPSSNFDESTDIGINWLTIQINETTENMITLGVVNNPLMYVWEEDEHFERGMTTYGVFVEQYTPETGARELKIEYPLVQRGAQVFVTVGIVEVSGSGSHPGEAGTATVVGDSAEFKTGSDIVRIGEGIGGVKATFTSEDLDALASGVFLTSPVKQYLKFGDTSAYVSYTKNNEDEVGDFLYFPQDTYIFEYHIDLTEGAVSDIVNNELIDLKDKIILIMGKYFKIENASLFDEKGITLTLRSLNLMGSTGSSYISINSTTGLINFSPPSDWTGLFSVEIRVSDGRDSISKIINFNVTPKDDEPMPPGNGDGSSGGGGSAFNSDRYWNCGEWSECVDGEQTQVCTHKFRIGTTKTNTQSCEVEEKPVETSSAEEESEEKQEEEITVSAQGTGTEVEEELPRKAELSDITGAVIKTPKQEKPVWPLILILGALGLAIALLIIKRKNRVF